MGITSDQAAELLDIAGGSLRQIETSVKPASLALVYRAARLYRCDVADLIAGNDGVPDEPPPQPKPPQAPARRQDKEGAKKAPKRVQAVAS